MYYFDKESKYLKVDLNDFSKEIINEFKETVYDILYSFDKGLSLSEPETNYFFLDCESEDNCFNIIEKLDNLHSAKIEPLLE